MYKEIVGITKNHLDYKIERLTKDLEILKHQLGNVDPAVQGFELAISVLEETRNVMLNACDYGIWLKEHKEKL